LGLSLTTFAQENLSYQKPSKSILELADFEEHQPYRWIQKKNICYYPIEIRTSIDDLNQDELL
jgi:hemerythrin superfamily protein